MDDENEVDRKDIIYIKIPKNLTVKQNGDRVIYKVKVLKILVYVHRVST